jgi:uncharacterized protein YbbC (DUF1343 family)
MLIIYDEGTKEVISISGFKGNPTREQIDSIHVIGLPDSQAEYRIYDTQKINQIWQAKDEQNKIELVFDGENPVDVEIIEVPYVPYTVSNNPVAVNEVTTITVPSNTIALIDNQEYIIDDGVLEYSNENPGTHQILLRLNGYKDVAIEIEVIE